MPININDQDYVQAEREFYEADTLEEKLIALKKMISHAPGHKGAENLRQQLTTRRKKLEQQITKAKKSGKSTQKGIKKEEMQVVLVGFSNTGKSLLLTELTNASPKVSEIKFTTKEPKIGIMKYKTINIQIIENPSINSEYFDKGLINSADVLLLIINSLEEIKELKEKTINSPAKKIIVFNKSDKLDSKQKRKISETLKSKKYNFTIISAKNKENLEELKEKIFKCFNKIRIYTKEPNQKEKSKKPMILKKDSTVKDAAEKILKGFSENIKTIKIWGPSSKFSGQIVGLKHKLKDLDTIELRTR